MSDLAAPTLLLAQLEVEDCTAELFLNGIPLVRIAPPKMHIENALAEHIIVPGTNRLDVVIEPGSHPSVDRTEQRQLPFRPMSAVGRLIRFPIGVPGLAELGEVLGETSFTWSETAPDGSSSRGPRVFPVEVGTQIELGAAHGRWGWQDAERLVLDDALIAEAAALLDDVDRAWRRADTARVWALTELLMKDVQRAMPGSTEPVLRAELAGLMADRHSAPDGVNPVLPRDPARWDFRLVAGDRLLQLIERDYSTAFKFRDPQGRPPAAYKLFVGRAPGDGNDRALRIFR